MSTHDPTRTPTAKLASTPFYMPSSDQVYLLNLIAFLVKQLGGSVAISESESRQLFLENPNLEVSNYKTETGALIIEVEEK